MQTDLLLRYCDTAVGNKISRGDIRCIIFSAMPHRYWSAYLYV